MTLTIDHAVTTRQDSGAMTDLTPPDPEVRDRSSGRRRFSAKYKTKILAEYEALDRSERGALLRREGLYSSLIVDSRRRTTGAEEKRWHERRGARAPILEIRSPG